MNREDYLANTLTDEDRKLIRLFQDEVRKLDTLYYRAINSNDTKKSQELLGKIKDISRTLKESYSERADLVIPKEYLKGATYIDDSISGTSGLNVVLNASEKEIRSQLKKLGPAHIEAVNALLNTSKNYVKSSLDGMERQAMTMISELQGEKVREELAKGTITGENLASMEERIKRYFQKNRISGFKDRSGRLWSMDRYVDMLTRTETSIANIQGTINRAIQLGITKFKIVEASDCCEYCAEYNGEIVDIKDGVVDLPPFHPNCRGYIISVMEDGTERQIGGEEVNNNINSAKYGDYRDFKLNDAMLDNYDIDEARRFMENKYGDSIEEFGIGKDNAIISSAYTGGLFADMNHALRTNEGDGIFFDMADQFSEVIKHNSESYDYLYRGMALDKSVVENWTKGMIYSDKAFSSFTLNPSIASMYGVSYEIDNKVGVILELEGGKGMNMYNYTQFSEESEIVIDKGAKMYIKNIDKQANGYVVKMGMI